MKHWWRTRTIRFRLALWYACCGLFLLATLGAVIYLYVADRLASPLDIRMREDLGQIRQRLAIGPGAGITWDGLPPPAAETWNRDDPWFELWDENGGLVRRFWPTSKVELLPIAPARGRETISVYRDLGLRALSVPFPVPGRSETWMIRVFNPHLPAGAALGVLRWTLFIAVPGIVALLVGGGYAMMRYWVKPLDQILVEADGINAENFSRRLAVHNPHDELGRMATVFNRTLDRLERSFLDLDRFVADASHELRTPLTTLRTVGQVALRRSRTEPEYREVIASMLEESQHLELLIHRLLELASIEGNAVDIHRSRIRLDVLVEACARELEVLADLKHQQIVVEKTECYVDTDSTLVRQALQNLVDNAIKYGPDHSRITVSVRDTGLYCEVDVRDEGPGLSAASLEHFAERFYRPDDARSRRKGGFGLGLSITMAYMRALGGSIEYQPVESGGGWFRLTLPRS